MKSSLGRELILHKNAFPDQKTEADNDVFVRVKIIEVKAVRGTWDQKAEYEGWLATDVKTGTSGTRRFYSQWEDFDDSSSLPRWMWSEKVKSAWETWYDVTQGLYSLIPTNHGEPVFVTENADLIGFCEKHASLYYKNTGGIDCFRCEYNLDGPVKIEVWRGWFKTPVHKGE
jgi:hypothetical protein